MMVLDGVVDKSSVNQEICKSDVTVHQTCEKSEGLHPAELGLTAEKLCGR